MYKCQICNTLVTAKTKATVVPIETRSRSYPRRVKANRAVRRPKGNTEYPDDPGGKGYETVRQAHACPQCVIKYREQSGWP